MQEINMHIELKNNSISEIGLTYPVFVIKQKDQCCACKYSFNQEVSKFPI